MKIFMFKVLSLIALIASVLPSLMFMAGWMSHEAVMWTTLIGTFLWFLSTPVWMGQDLPVDATEVEI